MKTTDVPYTRETTTVAEAKDTSARKSTTTSADKDTNVASDPRFASSGSGSPQAGSTSLPMAAGRPRAAESTDPAVHQALAELQAAQLNRDSLGPPSDEAVKVADREVDEAKKKLRDLGYPQD